MESEKEPSFVLTERDESNILLLCDIAKVNDASLSLEELLRLTSLGATEEEVANAWRFSKVLDSKYVLESGLILEKGRNSEITLTSKKEEANREARARSNIEYSRRFASLCSGRDIRALSISGSTSYLSVSGSDDLDFFTITSKDAVWLFLTKSLLLSRLQRMISSQNPEICLSYTVDEGSAERAFLLSRSALFARDALTVLPILGSSYYKSLLARSSWMAEFFPKLYRSRVTHSKDAEIRVENRPPVFYTVANMFLYYTVGTYVRAKSWMLNRRFAKWGKHDRIFKLRIGADLCIFEARSYIDLRHLYSKIKSSTV